MDSEHVLNKLHIILDKDLCREKDPDSYYIAQILDFLIDADRLDYLRRDGIHTYEQLTVERWENVIQGTCTAELQDPKNKQESHPLRRLVFNITHKKIIQSILMFRRDMYVNVYEHPEKIIIDDMLSHALYYVMRLNKIIPSEENDPSSREQAIHATRELLRLVDDDLIHFILESADPKHVQGRRALDLIFDIYRGRPYKEIAPRCTITRDEVKQAENNLDKANETLNENIRSILNARLQAADFTADGIEARYSLDKREFYNIAKEMFAQLTDKGNWGDYEDLLFFDFYLMRGRFLRKCRVEQSFWGRLLGDKQFRHIVENYMAGRYGTQDITKYVTEEVPLIHISLTGYSRFTARDVMEHSTESVQDERLAFYDASKPDSCSPGHHKAGDGCMYSFFLPDPATSESFQAWSVILSAPVELVNDSQATQIINTQWRKFMFEDRAWILVMY